MTEPEKRSAREEYDRKVRERARREQNYKKLKAFTETQAKQAKEELEACYEEIEELYRNRIVVYENTDDEYKKTAMDLYQQCTSFGQRLKDLVTKTEEMKWDVRRGALAAVLDLVKTALAIQDLKNTLDTLPFAVVAEVMGIEVPGLSLEKVDDLKNMASGAVAALQDPPRVLAALGQKIGDTVEEEGIAYSISYVAADVAIQVLLSKGLGEVKNVSKADDLVDVARTVDTLDDTVKIADELTDAAKVVDQVGDIADAAMAVNAVDETNAAVKAVDNVSDAAKTVEKLDGVIETSYGKSTLNSLKNTENFTDSAIEHIFEGQVNARGKAVGYHYKGIEGTSGNVIPGTESSTNNFGIYKAKVEVNGIPKTANGGFSSFYPKSMSPQEVIGSINEAYRNRVYIRGNTYSGLTSSGMEIEMFLDKNGKIISAYPVY